MTSQYKSEFDSCREWLITEYKSVQAGRANPSMLDTLRVEVYGSLTPIANIASVTLEDAHTLRVSPWDKSQTRDIEKAISEAGLPFSVVTDSNGLRVITPQMTEETRKKILKHAGSLHEEARIAVRKVRQEANDAIESAQKSKEITEDDAKRYKEEIQKMVDDMNKKLDEIYSEKEKDIMTI